MARQGVFNREVTQLEQIKRSLQQLNHRHSTTLEYGVIIPNFTEYLYPNETLRLKTTNYLRTIPLKTPQLTRVRVVQRFAAFPMRLLWEFFPEYINALNPPKEGIPEEPYIANFNSLATSYAKLEDGVYKGYSTSARVLVATLMSRGYTDTSACGIANKYGAISGQYFPSMHRYLYFATASQLAPTQVENYESGYQFFPHELGDYLNAPLYSASLSRDTSSRFAAYKFAAYQLGYSFFYRRPNIEERIDDYYEMAKQGYADQLFSEFPRFYGTFVRQDGQNKIIPPISEALADTSTLVRHTKAVLFNPSAINDNRALINNATSSATAAVRATSWENVEHFPLKAGANFSMQARYNDANGRVAYADSTISLTRLRYAPWFLDRFTSANPWPQRGDEALIPVNGTIAVTLPDSTTVSFSGITANIPRNNLYVYGTGDTEGNSYNVYAKNIGQNLSNGSLSLQLAAGQNTLVDNSEAGTGIGLLETAAYQASIEGSASASFSSTAANVQYALNVSPSNFRFYMQLQHMKEMSGMTDGRYKSFLSMFFGSHDKDYRLDRPEFIGGFVQDLDISEVIQTSETTSDSPLGAMAGRGISAKRGSSISYHAFEHTLVMGFLHIVPDVEYIGGLNRQDNTTDPFDWILPQFAGLSEQPIRMKELVCLPSSLNTFVTAANNAVFGYEPRFNERRARHSFVTGAFRDTMNSTGNYEYYKPWLVTRNFGFDVTLSVSGSESYYLSKLNFVVPSLSKEFVTTRHNCDYSNFDVTDPSVMKPFMLDSYFEERLTAIIPRRGIPKI